jgi:hypothetical protein
MTSRDFREQPADPVVASASENKRRYAARDGIATLYKFRPYSTDMDRSRVLEILVDHRVYFARASELNDDRDLRPNLRFRGSSEQETRKLILEDAEKVWPRREPPYSASELAAQRERLTTLPIDQLEFDALQRVHQRLEKNYWVFSMSASRDYLAMWDDYADKRRGLCIHFRSDEDSPFGTAQRVLYESDIPTLLVPLGPIREVADAAVLTKTLRWKQEREYRLVRYLDLDYSAAQLRFDGQYAYFPSWALSGVTVGLDMSSDHVQEVLSLADAHDPPLPVWRPNGIILDGSPAR